MSVQSCDIIILVFELNAHKTIEHYQSHLKMFTLSGLQTQHSQNVVIGSMIQSVI